VRRPSKGSNLANPRTPRSVAIVTQPQLDTEIGEWQESSFERQKGNSGSVFGGASRWLS
jgi:hypothetical protein